MDTMANISLLNVWQAYVLDKFEGGLVNDPHDPGALTNRGVTYDTWVIYALEEGWEANPDGLRNMSQAQYDFICKDFIKQSGADRLASVSLALELVDFSWGSGPGNAGEVLQILLNKSFGATLSVDGKVGAMTAGFVNGLPDEGKVLDAFHQARFAFLKASRNPKTGTLLWPFFGIGWTRRMDALKSVADSLLGTVDYVEKKSPRLL